MGRDPRRYADRPKDQQRQIFEDIIRDSPIVMRALEQARELAAPDWRLVSGALYQTVWNALTDRPDGYGLKDLDIAYFDDSDLSWDAEDVVIKRADVVFAGGAVPVEVRNQARVHLWFEERFGDPYAQLGSTDECLERYTTIAHAVGVRLEADGALDVAAPFGLDDIFALRVRANPKCVTPGNYAEKAARAKATWPEVEEVAASPNRP